MNPLIGCSPLKTLPTISEFRWRRSTGGATATKDHPVAVSGGIYASDGTTSRAG